MNDELRSKEVKFSEIHIKCGGDEKFNARTIQMIAEEVKKSGVAYKELRLEIEC